jgi:hypothetical protein
VLCVIASVSLTMSGAIPSEQTTDGTHSILNLSVPTVQYFDRKIEGVSGKHRCNRSFKWKEIPTASIFARLLQAWLATSPKAR